MLTVWTNLCQILFVPSNNTVIHLAATGASSAVSLASIKRFQQNWKIGKFSPHLCTHFSRKM